MDHKVYKVQLEQQVTQDQLVHKEQKEVQALQVLKELQVKKVLMELLVQQDQLVFRVQ